MAAIRLVVCALLGSAGHTLADLVGIPTVPFSVASHGSAFDLHRVRSIAVDSRYAATTDTEGWTLIPPSLWDFAATFQDDWSSVGGTNASLATCDGTAPNGSIFLTLGNSSDFRDAAGRWTSEAYRLDVGETNVVITGASPLGVWWGTRTLLQQAALHNGSLPVGSGVDSPGWNTRGIFV